MATWRDGPEYAPLERPAAFVTPAVTPLPTAPEPPPPPAAPAEEPSFSPPSAELPDLAALVPSAAPGRNPHLPFEVAEAAVTTAGGWSTGPASGGQSGTPQRTPEQPFSAPGPPLTGYLPVQPTVHPNAQVNPPPFPAPGTPQWFAPPPETRVPDAPPAVTIGQIWRAATPGVLIPLLVGAVFSWLAIFMLAVSFALSARIPYRREAVRRAYVVALIVLGTMGAGSILTQGANSDLLFETLSGGAQLACLVLTVVVGLIVGAALRAGERPDRIG